MSGKKIQKIFLKIVHQVSSGFFSCLETLMKPSRSLLKWYIKRIQPWWIVKSIGTKEKRKMNETTVLMSFFFLFKTAIAFKSKFSKVVMIYKAALDFG